MGPAGNRRAAHALRVLDGIHGDQPTAEEEKAFKFACESGQHKNLAKLSAMARRWRRMDLWEAAILGVSDGDVLDDVFNAMSDFGLSVVCKT